MKKISFYLIAIIAAGTMFFAGCTNDSYLETPDNSILPEQFGVDIPTALSYEDNLKILERIPMARAIGIKMISFCMGPLGRISRIASPVMGGYMTFASLESGAESASGQIPVRDLRKILEMLSS